MKMIAKKLHGLVPSISFFSLDWRAQGWTCLQWMSTIASRDCFKPIRIGGNFDDGVNHCGEL